MDKGKAVRVVCLGFSKAFDNISHSILLGKLASQENAGNGVDRCIFLLDEEWQVSERGGEWSYI